MSAEPMSYIARCAICNGFVMAFVDKPEHAKDIAREVALCIRNGDVVERVTCQFVRDNWVSCKCDEPEAEQTEMGIVS